MDAGLEADTVTEFARDGVREFMAARIVSRSETSHPASPYFEYLWRIPSHITVEGSIWYKWTRHESGGMEILLPRGLTGSGVGN